MEALESLLGGFATALQPRYLLFAILGVILGNAIGVLPGVGPAIALALLLPLTYSLEPTGAFIMFAGIYYGGLFGGSTTAILMRTPGEATSVVTVLDGYPMAQKGRAGAALSTAIIGSFVAMTIATIGLTFLGPLIASFAVRFQPADYFALAVLAFLSVAGLLGRSLVRGMISLLLGLTLAVVGIDTQSGQARLTFGQAALLDGFDVILVAIGLFAVGEALHSAARLRSGNDPVIPLRGKLGMTREEWSRSWKPWLRGAAIGFPMGALPAGGADIPTFVSYNMEKQLSKHPEEFGKGAIEGVAGPEAAGIAAFSGVLIPLLTLGIPTSATAAILLAAFQVYNLQPGPLLFETSGDLVWALIASLFIGNVMLLLLNLPLIRVWIKLLKAPKSLLYAAILMFASLGVYSVSGSALDLMFMYAIGFLGFIMRRFDVPIAPFILGVILGPLMEAQFRRSMSISQGDASIFFTRPLSATILAVAFLALLLPYVPGLIARLRGKGSVHRTVIGEVSAPSGDTVSVSSGADAGDSVADGTSGREAPRPPTPDQ